MNGLGDHQYHYSGLTTEWMWDDSSYHAHYPHISNASARGKDVEGGTNREDLTRSIDPVVYSQWETSLEDVCDNIR